MVLPNLARLSLGRPRVRTGLPGVNEGETVPDGRMEEIADDEDCPICVMPIKEERVEGEGNPVAYCKGGHLMHPSCRQQTLGWRDRNVHRSQNCPVCKTPVANQGPEGPVDADEDEAPGGSDSDEWEGEGEDYENYEEMEEEEEEEPETELESLDWQYPSATLQWVSVGSDGLEWNITVINSTLVDMLHMALQNEGFTSITASESGQISMEPRLDQYDPLGLVQETFGVIAALLEHTPRLASTRGLQFTWGYHYRPASRSYPDRPTLRLRVLITGLRPMAYINRTAPQWISDPQSNYNLTLRDGNLNLTDLWYDMWVETATGNRRRYDGYELERVRQITSHEGFAIDTQMYFTRR